MLISVPGRTYAYVAFAVGVFTPVLVAVSFPSVLTIIGTLIVEAIILFPVFYCSTAQYSFLSAMGDLSGRYCSGCANITIAYIWVPIAFYWLVALRFSILGLFKGRMESQRLWHDYVMKIVRPHLFALDRVDWDTKQLFGIWEAMGDAQPARHFAFFLDGTYIFVDPGNGPADVMEAGTWKQEVGALSMDPFASRTSHDGFPGDPYLLAVGSESKQFEWSGCVFRRTS